MLKPEWDALSKRISGIVEASTFFFHCRDNDESFSTNVLMETCKETADAVKRLSIYKHSMQLRAIDALGRFEKWWDETAKLGVSGFQGVMAYTTVLASFRSEFDHLFVDHDAVVRSRVARAFLHLQRSLVVDTSLRKKWQVAFKKGEIYCEQLGAIHLLSHGIYAFKTSDTGARTDIILGDHLIVDESIISAASGLVLTEWKLVRDKKEAEGKRTLAKRQAQLYNEGPLAGFELRSEQYLVLVGDQEFEVSPEEIDGLVTYKSISVILNPQIPSKAARRTR